jgi:hypothetical protein
MFGQPAAGPRRGIAAVMHAIQRFCNRFLEFGEKDILSKVTVQKKAFLGTIANDAGRHRHFPQHISRANSRAN